MGQFADHVEKIDFYSTTCTDKFHIEKVFQFDTLKNEKSMPICLMSCIKVLSKRVCLKA